MGAFVGGALGVVRMEEAAAAGHGPGVSGSPALCQGRVVALSTIMMHAVHLLAVHSLWLQVVAQTWRAAGVMGSLCAPRELCLLR